LNEIERNLQDAPNNNHSLRQGQGFHSHHRPNLGLARRLEQGLSTWIWVQRSKSPTTRNACSFYTTFSNIVLGNRTSKK
jgi:hypothetical protein